MATMSSATPLNRSTMEASRARNPKAMASNRSISKRLSSASAPTKFSNQVTLSFNTSIPDTLYEQPCFDTNCHNTVFKVQILVS
ncbi:hypothetical protein CsSME_00045327 [Camellia sinensis var. sinensis]